MHTRILIAFPLLIATGCTGLIETDSSFSPDDPKDFSSRMFDEAALGEYSPEDRAYVQGHALAVYLYGKTLPGYVGHKGFDYKPGLSSEDAAVAYNWDAVMTASSGGIYGYGDDVDGPVADPTDGEECDPFDPDCEPVDPECDPFDPDCDPGGGECDPFDPDCDPGGGECDPFVEDCDDEPIDEDCEEFLDPAALDARRLQQEIDVQLVLGDLTPTDPETIAAFQKGLREALLLQDLNEDTRHSEVEHIKSEVQDEGLCTHSPLILDLNGDGLSLSTVAEGVDFDLLSKGRSVRTSWIQDDDALLVLDRNGDGIINSGRELFGNTSSSRNGFVSLAALDLPSQGGNADGVLDERDALFTKLQVWNDRNRDGQSDADELRLLAAVGVVSVDLEYESSSMIDEAGNAHKEQATFVRRVGENYSSHSVVDVWFKFTRK